MLDPVTASSDRLQTQERGRWGYTGDMVEDPVPAIEESEGASRWLLWIAVLAIVVIALVALFGGAI